MLHEFLIASRTEILQRSQSRLVALARPSPAAPEHVHGLPVFIDQLIAILGQDTADRAAAHHGVGVSASLHGGELRQVGLTVAQVVQHYGSICQSVTELADERNLSMEVVGEAASGPAAESGVTETAPDVVLMDVSMPGGGGGATALRHLAVMRVSKSTRLMPKEPR